MKRAIIFVLLAVLLTTCNKDKEPATGDLRIFLEYDGSIQPEVECYLYSSWDNYVSYTFLDRQISDENGEVFFPELAPGWYYFDAERVFSSLFTVYAMDSVLVESGLLSQKLLILYPEE